MGAFLHCPEFLNQLRAFILWCFLNERETCYKESEHAFAHTTPIGRLQQIIN